MSIFGAPSRLVDIAPMVHPAVARVQRLCPTRKQVLQAAQVAQRPPPEKPEIIFQNGYDLFSKFCIGLPKGYREKGQMIETAFRPILHDAQQAVECLPIGHVPTTQIDAQSVVKAYVCVHWMLGAREAAMALYSATD